jgi:hypothetical protein
MPAYSQRLQAAQLGGVVRGDGLQVVGVQREQLAVAGSRRVDRAGRAHQPVRAGQLACSQHRQRLAAGAAAQLDRALADDEAAAAALPAPGHHVATPGADGVQARRQVVEKGGGERPEELDLGEAPAHGRASQGGAARVQGGAGRRGRETRLKASTLALDSWLESPGPGGSIMRRPGESHWPPVSLISVAFRWEPLAAW